MRMLSENEEVDEETSYWGPQTNVSYKKTEVIT